MGHRFVVDMTLGKLARWLRILGFDTLLIREGTVGSIPEQEGRLFLSRNRVLLHRAGGQSHLLLRSHRVTEQLRELFSALQITPNDLNDLNGAPRCSLCNMELVQMERCAVGILVPKYVASHAPRFGRCPHCTRIYWPGTHRQRMTILMKQVFPPGKLQNDQPSFLHCGS